MVEGHAFLLHALLWVAFKTPICINLAAVSVIIEHVLIRAQLSTWRNIESYWVYYCLRAQIWQDISKLSCFKKHDVRFSLIVLIRDLVLLIYFENILIERV